MSAAGEAVDWVAIDWGTSNLRAWAMRGGEALEERSSDQGMGRLRPEGFEPALRALAGDWLGAGAPGVACGMVGARQGWVEAPYAPVPGPPLAPGLTPAPGPWRVGIVPGLAQSDPPDVMRGEETQVAGHLSRAPSWEGTLCLPGTHCKWVAVSAGEVTGFRTFLTGELFALLAAQSVLRHSVGEGPDGPGFEAAFDEGVAEGLADPSQVASRLFAIRAASLLAGLPPEAARGRLSGLLIGLELAGARAWWLGARVAVLGAGGLAGLYARALAAQGAAPEIVDATAATLAGLRAAHDGWRESTA